MIEQLRYLTPTQVHAIAEQWGTPVFVYSEALLRRQARAALAVEAPYGLTVRYAMKANPQSAILRIFKQEGLSIDASSGPEVERALRAGFAPQQILVTSQQLPDNLRDLTGQGVRFNASSLHQLQQLGQAAPGSRIGLRINPGLGSGHSMHVNVGGETSSFGIWHEYIEQAKNLAAQYNLRIERIHTHIGSATDPKAWHKAVGISLKLVEQFADTTIINLGGGFKIGRITHEHSTDINLAGQDVAKELRDFAARTGRQLHLEIEPGSYLVVEAGAIISRVHDIVDTGTEGLSFIKADIGLNDFLRPAMYGSQHAIVVVNNSKRTKDYVVVGRTCESADMLTPADHQPGVIEPRQLAQAQIGDYLVVEGTGAYVYTLNFNGYNSYGQATQVLLQEDGNTQLIYRGQTLDDLLANEVL